MTEFYIYLVFTYLPTYFIQWHQTVNDRTQPIMGCSNISIYQFKCLKWLTKNDALVKTRNYFIALDLMCFYSYFYHIFLTMNSLYKIILWKKIFRFTEIKWSRTLIFFRLCQNPADNIIQKTLGVIMEKLDLRLSIITCVYLSIKKRIGYLSPLWNIVLNLYKIIKYLSFLQAGEMSII